MTRCNVEILAAIRYCSEDCQLRHRSRHRELYVKLRAAACMGPEKRLARAVSLQVANDESFLALQAIVGWPRINAFANLQQEEQIWRQRGDFANTALTHLRAIRALSDLAFTRHFVGDIPAEERRDCNVHLPLSNTTTSTTNVREFMMISLHVAKLVVHFHKLGTLEQELADMQALLDSTAAAIEQTLAEQHSIILPDYPNNSMC